jgi:hypothetical protein
VVLTALDSDVIKSYVSLGLGVGIISSRAFVAGKDEGLKALDCEHLFPAQTTRLAFKRGTYLRSYVVEFIRLFAPHVTAVDLKQLEQVSAEDFASSPHLARCCSSPAPSPPSLPSTDFARAVAHLELQPEVELG